MSSLQSRKSNNTCIQETNSLHQSWATYSWTLNTTLKGKCIKVKSNQNSCAGCQNLDSIMWVSNSSLVVTGDMYTFHKVEFQCQEHAWWATHVQWKSDKLILFKEQDTWSLSDFRKRRPRLELSGIRTTSFTAFSSSLAGSGGSDALLTASCLSNSFKDPG